jgi:hypothetical protein
MFYIRVNSDMPTVAQGPQLVKQLHANSIVVSSAKDGMVLKINSDMPAVTHDAIF